MGWIVEFLNEDVRAELETLPLDIQASFLRIEKGEGGPMSRKTIPVEGAAREWIADAAFQKEYDALEEEFALAAALIHARSEAHMTQEQVAEAMGTTQAVVARLESGRATPSTRTLQRFAKATKSRLRITFEPTSTDSAASGR